MSATPRKLLCPVCEAPLREEVVEGVTADLCPDHGLWLDKDELRQIVERIKLVQLGKARRVLRTTPSREIAKTSMTDGVLGRWFNRF